MTTVQRPGLYEIQPAETFAQMAAVARGRVEKDEARLEKSRVDEALVLQGIRAALWGPE